MTRILVCGGRDYSDKDCLFQTMDSIYHSCLMDGKGTDTIIHGGASGADNLAGLWATSKTAGIKVEVYRADWKKYGKAAGPIRNMEMLSKGKPDLVVAFPGGRGTQNMVALARKAGVEVMEVK